MNNPREACAMCYHQRRECPPDCIFAPYFPPERISDTRYAIKFFGVFRIRKILEEVEPHLREYAMLTMMGEAKAHAVDPVHGLCNVIDHFGRQLELKRAELDDAEKQLRRLEQVPDQERKAAQDIVPEANSSSASNDQMPDKLEAFHSTFYHHFPTAESWEKYSQMREQEATSMLNDNVDISDAHSFVPTYNPMEKCSFSHEHQDFQQVDGADNVGDSNLRRQQQQDLALDESPPADPNLDLCDSNSEG